MSASNYIKNYLLKSLIKLKRETKPLNAYELWAETYDEESGNLMLYFDRILFKEKPCKINWLRYFRKYD